jgi:hypothetical protein
MECWLASLCSRTHESLNFCDSFSILGTVCQNDPGMGFMKGFENYKALCKPSDSRVKQCKDIPSIPSMVSTFSATASAKELCKSSSRESCSSCLSSRFCSDPLNILVYFCSRDPQLPECSDWNEISASIAQEGFQICRSPFDVLDSEVDSLVFYRFLLSVVFLHKYQLWCRESVQKHGSNEWVLCLKILH